MNPRNFTHMYKQNCLKPNKLTKNTCGSTKANSKPCSTFDYLRGS